MVANFPKLHHKVHKIFHLRLALYQLEQVSSGDFVLYPLIKNSLPVSHLTSMSVLCLGANLKLNVVLESTEHKGFQDQVKASELMFVYFTLISQRVLLNILGEPLLELFVAVKQLGHDKMQESPELSH